MPSFVEAFESLLSLAPGPVFPRARQLYLRKYPLEAAECTQRFRTFLFAEAIEEQQGLVRVNALAFAVVHWQAPQTTEADYASYLQERWQLQPRQLELDDASWFRDGGAFARFQAEAVYERGRSGALLLDES